MPSNNTLGFIIFLLVAIVGGLVFIWSLNTLFPILAIPYTFKTLLAAVLIVSSVGYKKS